MSKLVKQDAVKDGRICPGVATWRTGRNIRVVFDSGLFPLLYDYENMMSSTKPEVHNVLHCRRRMTGPRIRLACTENVVKHGRAVIEMCKQTDRQTDTFIAILRKSQSFRE